MFVALSAFYSAIGLNLPPYASFCLTLFVLRFEKNFEFQNKSKNQTCPAKRKKGGFGVPHPRLNIGLGLTAMTEGLMAVIAFMPLLIESLAGVTDNVGGIMLFVLLAAAMLVMAIVMEKINEQMTAFVESMTPRPMKCLRDKPITLTRPTGCGTNISLRIFSTVINTAADGIVRSAGGGHTVLRRVWRYFGAQQSAVAERPK
ncbi:MAG: hypothetical protein LBL66_02585 [Clostridiales bacterium]|nr:hypothetical protein [Clostridiales bacterium]